MSNDEEMLSLIRAISNRLAILEKNMAEERSERMNYRREREAKENPVMDSSTLEKIDHIYKQSTSLWVFFREKIIPSVLVAVIVWWLTSR